MKNQYSVYFCFELNVYGKVTIVEKQRSFYVTNSVFFCLAGKLDFVNNLSFIPGQQQCIDTVGLIYSGTVSVTQQVIACQRWDSQQPHAHAYTNPARFPDDTLVDAANYCRAPDGRTIPWCFTTSVDQLWDYCNMDDINAGIQCNINRVKTMHFDTYDMFGEVM